MRRQDQQVRLIPVQIVQSLDYPAVEVNVQRSFAGRSGVTAGMVARSVAAATSSSRFTTPLFWPDAKTGVGYQVQVELPRPALASAADLGAVPIKQGPDTALLLRDVATVTTGKMPGQFDRFNMKRETSISANIAGTDLGRAAAAVRRAVAAAGDAPKGASVQYRGQMPILEEARAGLTAGLGLTALCSALLVAAAFQSLRAPLLVVVTAAAALAGAAAALRITGTTLNLQSFIGAVAGLGVGVANLILLLSFAEERRRAGANAATAAREAAAARFRPILMTSAAMLAGMLPMALGATAGGDAGAPLGRAAMGALFAATAANLLLAPLAYAAAFGGRPARSASLDPEDPLSRHFAPPPASGVVP